jgi:transcriptional regulator with XRE-family HTH domain
MSQAELARLSGVDRSTINRFLKGGATLSIQQLGWIARALGVSLDDLGMQVADEARQVMTEIESAIARAVTAEAECSQLREQLKERGDELVAARQETMSALEACAANVAQARAGADDELKKALEIERARAAKEVEAAVGHERKRWTATVGRLEDEVDRLMKKLEATSAALLRANTDALKWFQHSQALKDQLDKKSGEVVGVGLLAALGGLMLADNKPRRRRR